jgi:hypothetical protein
MNDLIQMLFLIATVTRAFLFPKSENNENCTKNSMSFVWNDWELSAMIALVTAESRARRLWDISVLARWIRSGSRWSASLQVPRLRGDLFWDMPDSSISPFTGSGQRCGEDNSRAWCFTMGSASPDLSAVKNNPMDHYLLHSTYFPFAAMLQCIGPICWSTQGKRFSKCQR